MATPSFDGLQIFGVDPTISTAAHPHRLQVQSFPGVNGRSALRHGADGGYSVAVFTMIAPGEAQLAALEAAWRSYQIAATPCMLVDTLGVAWPWVVLMEFEPLEPIRPANGGLMRRYRAHFEHFS